MKSNLIMLTVLLAAHTASALGLHAREIINLDKGWRFTLSKPKGTVQEPAFDDSGWSDVDVPHDWAFEADYARNAAQRDKGGYKPGGLGWYRKQFQCPQDWAQKRVRIEFDGVYMCSDVWINGRHLGKRPYGYISFGYDISEHLQPGTNTIAVRVDNTLEPSARWYHGCGIYAHVKLVVTDRLHIAPDGVYITTPQVEDAQAEVVIETRIASAHPAGGDGLETRLKTAILDPEGATVAEADEQVVLKAGSEKSVRQTLTVLSPRRWDTHSPHLYRAVSRVVVGNRVLDEVTTRFGIRTIRWDKATGFHLNGRVVKLRGVCEHLEGGPVGSAYPDELIRWKIQLLKDMGCNAIRTAHNPQVPVFYDLCDEMGVLVMDEIFDGWRGKAPRDYGARFFQDWWQRDVRAWLKRDRNHPCIIIWSLGNETGGAVAPQLVRVCHEVDPTRLTTSGHSGSRHMDVYGINGHSEKTTFFKESRRGKPFVATEAPHTWQVRGYYRTQTWFRDGYPGRQSPFPCPNLTDKEIFTYDWIAPNKRNRKQIFNSSYDNAMVRVTARKNWELMRDLPWFSGHFRWTGFDYLGEAGYVHGGWPFRAFMGGPLDLAGFKKDLYHFYRSQWTREPMVHILPHWTHPKMKPGTRIPVWVYSNCDEVELFLNGKSLGKDRPGTPWDEMQCDWMVPWAPGKVEAVGYRAGKKVTHAVQTTAGAPAQLQATIQGKTCPIVTVLQLDEKGIINPYAENRIYYHVRGPARILSLESGNPVNTENNCGTSRTAFFGKARAFLQVSRPSDAYAVTVGAICGEKQLMTSRQVRIDVKSLAVNQDPAAPSCTIRYSTDGSKPSKAYEGAFALQKAATVRAEVFQDDELLFAMQETFGPDQGIYWPNHAGGIQGKAGRSASKGLGGDQAEDAKFQNAEVATKGSGFSGKGFLDFGQNRGAYVEWYQENDGGSGTYELAIRYSGRARGREGRGLELKVNGKPQSLFLPNTKNYGSDWRVLTVKIQLQRGANTIRLTTVENGGMYLDEILVR